MTDAFALLDESRRPWLDVDVLKARFLEKAATSHPDRVHAAGDAERSAATTRYAELNAAFNTLKEPRDRLLHLYDLEAGARPADIQRIPPGTMDLFVDVGQTCQETDEFLTKKQDVVSPMLKLGLMRESLERLERLHALLGRVNARRDELASELRHLNSAWESAPAVGSPERREALPLERLEQLYRAMSYVARWTGQIQERLVQLTL